MKFKRLCNSVLCICLVIITLNLGYAEQARLDTIRERIESRSYPSIFAAWGGVGSPPLIDRHRFEGLNDLQEMAIYDVHWGSYFIRWQSTEDGEHVPIIATGHISISRNWQRWMIHYNPNMLLLYAMTFSGIHDPQYMPADSPFWLRDSDGNRISDPSGFYFFDLTNEGFRKLLAKEIALAAESGLYDGVFFDAGKGVDDLDRSSRLAILKAIRTEVHDDFLIIMNTNRWRTDPGHAPYVNGLFMETVWDALPGEPNYPYTPDGIAQIEDTLLWASENLRQPTANCLEGWGMSEQVFDSPDNMRWMRLFTTMSLTCDNGSVLYNKGLGEHWVGHDHHWYDFWGVNLGQPISPKAQHYLVNGRERYAGLYIREFTNGWAVYNRSAITPTISLPEVTASVGTGKYDTSHTVGSLDGDIFLRTHATRVHRLDKLLTTSWAEIKRPNFRDQ